MKRFMRVIMCCWQWNRMK